MLSNKRLRDDDSAAELISVKRQKIDIDLIEVGQHAIDYARSIIHESKSYTSFANNELSPEQLNLLKNDINEMRKNYLKRKQSLIYSYNAKTYSLFKNKKLNVTKEQFNSWIAEHNDLAEFESSVLASQKFKMGNCGEQSQLVMHFILNYNKQHGTNIKAETIYMYGEYANHAFVVLNRDINSALNKIKTWGTDAIICDPWAGLVYKALDHRFKLSNWFRANDRNCIEPYDPNKHQLTFRFGTENLSQSTTTRNTVSVIFLSEHIESFRSILNKHKLNIQELCNIYKSEKNKKIFVDNIIHVLTVNIDHLQENISTIPQDYFYSIDAFANEFSLYVKKLNSQIFNDPEFSALLNSTLELMQIDLKNYLLKSTGLNYALPIDKFDFYNYVFHHIPEDDRLSFTIKYLESLKFERYEDICELVHFIPTNEQLNFIIQADEKLGNNEFWKLFIDSQLHTSIKNQNLDRFEVLLSLRSNSNIGKITFNDITLLGSAIEVGNLSMIERLLEKGADPEKYVYGQLDALEFLKKQTHDEYLNNKIYLKLVEKHRRHLLISNMLARLGTLFRSADGPFSEPGNISLGNQNNPFL